MSSMLRRPIALGACLVCCAVSFAAIAGPTSAAKARARAKAAPVAKSQTAKGKILEFVKGNLTLVTGKKFKVDEKTKVLTNRGKAGPEGWAMALCPGDDVVVTYDLKRTLSISVAPPVRIPNGEYTFTGRTKYTYTDPKTQEAKDIPLLWLKSAKGVRYVVELVDDTVMTGAGVEAETRGGQAILDSLKTGSTIEVTASAAQPTVDKYGDPETVVRVNGVLKAIRVSLVPAAG